MGKTMNIANLLSLLRLALAPFLVVAALAGSRTIFLILFAVALLSDALDGYLARRFKQASELGARLDSWGDCAVALATPVALWLLWPELIRREAPFVGGAMAALLIPILLGFIKYRRLTSYHTLGAKLAAVLLAAATPLLLLGGPSWPFRLAVAVLITAEIEEMAITFTLPSWQSNVLSLYHARKLRSNRTKNHTEKR